MPAKGYQAIELLGGFRLMDNDCAGFAGMKEVTQSALKTGIDYYFGVLLRVF